LFTAPVEAVRQVVAKAGCTLGDVDLFEINERSLWQMLACIHQLGISPDRVNVHGGAIALGHPIGASGARVLVTLLHALERRNGRIGVAALALAAVMRSRCSSSEIRHNEPTSLHRRHRGLIR